MNKNEYV
jgi:vacuolar-type H+-ATPase subunit F/Vma7